LSTFYLVINQKLAVSTINQQSMKKPLTEFLVALREARKDLVLRSINESHNYIRVSSNMSKMKPINSIF
jgi:hypothetical protein